MMELLLGILIGCWLMSTTDQEAHEGAERDRKQEQRRSQAYRVWASTHPRAAKIELLLTIIMLPVGIWAVFMLARVFPAHDAPPCIDTGCRILEDWILWVYQGIHSVIWWFVQLSAALALILVLREVALHLLNLFRRKRYDVWNEATIPTSATLAALGLALLGFGLIWFADIYPLRLSALG